MSEIITDMNIARKYLSGEMNVWTPDRQHAKAYAARNSTPSFALAAPEAMDRAPLKDVFLPRLLVRACRELYGSDWQFWPQFQADGTCFTAGAQVSMSGSRRLAIAAVQAGDEVISHTGQVRKVLEVKRRSHSGPMVHLNMFGASRALSATSKHPVLVRRVLNRLGGQLQLSRLIWVPMDAVKVGDYVMVPYEVQYKTPILSTEVVDTCETEARPAPSDSTLVSGGLAQKTRQVVVPNVGLFRDDFGYMVRVKNSHTSHVNGVMVFNLEVEEEHSYVVDGFAVHNCVGQSHKVLTDILAAAERYISGVKFLGRHSVAAVYGMSRVEIGRSPGAWQGSNGSWAAEALEKGAALLLEEMDLDPNPKTKKAFYEMTRQDELKALQWAASAAGVPSNYEEAANRRPIRGAASVSTLQEVRASLSILRPVNLCGQVHPSQNRRNGVSTDISRGGGHSTALVGMQYRENENRWYYDHLQSWGDYYQGEYARQNSDCKEDLMFATCVTQIPEEWVAQWLGERDCYSLYGMSGLQPIEDAFRILSLAS